MPKACWIHYSNGAERVYAFDRMELGDGGLRLFRSAQLIAEVQYEEIAGWVVTPDSSRGRALRTGPAPAHQD